MPAQPRTPDTAEPEYWRSVEEWMDTAQFRDLMRDEFPEDAAEWLDPVSRRSFLSLMGASAALAAAGCNPSLKPAPQRQVVPYVVQPAQIVPGVPLFFSTAMPQAGGIGFGLIVKSIEGRPIKVEGNPNHPTSLGSSDLQALAAPLTMYDPERSRSCTNRGAGTTFTAAMNSLTSSLASQNARGGEGVRILTEPTTSPTLLAMFDEFKKRYPKAKWIQYEPVTHDASRKASLAAFGKAVNTVYRFDQADVILSLDSDFLSTGPASVRHARDFAARRRVRLVHKHEHKAGEKHASHAEEVKKIGDKMNRLYVVESMVTSTGGIADHRLPLKPSEIEAFARALAGRLKITLPKGAAEGTPLSDSTKAWLEELAKDLEQPARKGRAVVIVGEQQPAAVHLIAYAINAALDAISAGPEDVKKSLYFTDPLNGNRGEDIAEIKQLTDEMNAGKVDLLFISGCNPVYDAPANLEFDKALTKVANVYHHGLYADETAGHANWHINAAHFLESWGDSRGHDGTIAITQPLIAPLYQGKTLLEIMAQAIAIEPSSQDGLNLVKAQARNYFDTVVKSGDPEIFWTTTLRDGVIANSALKPIAVAKTVNLDRVNEPGFTGGPTKAGLEIQFRADPVLHDGRQANNGWLQELPKPVTNLTWDNAAMVSPRTAQALKLSQAFGWTGGERGRTETDMVTLTVGDRKLVVAIHILPGHADDAITLHLGYGRDRAGKVGGQGGQDTRGFNAFKLRTTNAVWTASDVKVEKKPDESPYFLAIAGAYYAMEARRPVRSATLAQFQNDPVFAQIPPISPGEFKEIRALTPGTPENLAETLGIKDAARNPYHHEHKHEHEDKRIIPLTLYKENPYRVNGEDPNKSYRRWAMTIDLGTCIGCAACTLACVAENNIPVVGKDQVTRGRAMHWLRIDRYFSIPGENPMDDRLGDHKLNAAERQERVKNSAAIRAHFQPVLCQHCEKAPCEVVCPVAATVHSADGLNDMVYNRCVGTRYCSNNCPYKVRRFNFLQYSNYVTESLTLLNNPEVTVRTRGVMEKCTYCVQRIRNAEIEAEREHAIRPKDINGRPKIKDGEVITACQQACPTQSINFGDLNDPESKVLINKAEPHNYGLLAELNTMPRTSYLAAIRNPNPNMPKGA